MALSADRGYQPVDIIVLVYFLVTGLLLLFSPHTFPGQARYAIVHFLILLAVACLRFVPRRGHPVLQVFRDWYFFFGLPFFYDSVQYLNRLITPRYFDEPLVAIEQSLFGAQPSQMLHEVVPFTAVSEFLHFIYLFYLSLIALVGLSLYISRRVAAYRVFATSTLATFFFCYLLFIIIPVRGPFHYFGPLELGMHGGYVSAFVHRLLHNSSSPGTAFPSSHVAVAVCIWMVSRRYQKWVSKIVLVAVAGIFVGTVYGGFHYAVDALAGLGVGLVFGVLGPWIHERLLRLQGAGGEPARVT